MHRVWHDIISRLVLEYGHMAYRIIFSEEAQDHLENLSVRERQIVLARIRASLLEAPTRETRNLKVLRPNPLARYELRAGSLRVFFDPSEVEGTVRVLAIGRKRRNRLIVGGQEVSL